jgi:hypothetical protein
MKSKLNKVMKSKLNKGMKTYTYTIAVFAALTIASQAQFTSVADLAANDPTFIATVESKRPLDQAAVVCDRTGVTTLPDMLTAWRSREDVQAVIAPAAKQIIAAGPALAQHVIYEGVARDWLKTPAGEAWAANNKKTVAGFLSDSPNQHLFLANEYPTLELFTAWKNSGYARPLGEVPQLENIAFIAAFRESWDTITSMDRSSFTYDVFSYPLYAKWAKARSEGESPEKDYDFIQKELMNVGMAGTDGSLPIVEHLGKLSQLLFNMIRQNEALQNP